MTGLYKFIPLANAIATVCHHWKENHFSKNPIPDKKNSIHFPAVWHLFNLHCFFNVV